MEKEHAMRSLGFFGLIRKALLMFACHARILVAIAFTFLLPSISLNFFIISFFIGKIIAHATMLVKQSNIDVYLDMVNLEWTLVGYLALATMFSFIPTAALIYSVACIYAEQKIKFMKIVRAVPQIWWRLVLTWIWRLLIQIIFGVLLSICAVTAFLWTLGLSLVTDRITIVVFASLAFLAFTSYIDVCWHLANVMIVVEDKYGLEALEKSFLLVKGKFGVGFAILLLHTFIAMLIVPIYSTKMYKHGVVELCYGFMLIILLTFVKLMGMLLHSLFYFSCKSYHHENIDILLLSDQLNGQARGYMSVKDFSEPTKCDEA